MATRCPASGLLGVGAGRAYAPNKAPGPYARGGVRGSECLGAPQNIRFLGLKTGKLRSRILLAIRDDYIIPPW